MVVYLSVIEWHACALTYTLTVHPRLFAKSPLRGFPLLSQLIFAHKQALPPSICPRPSSYASIKPDGDILTGEL